MHRTAKNLLALHFLCDAFELLQICPDACALPTICRNPFGLPGNCVTFSDCRKYVVTLSDRTKFVESCGLPKICRKPYCLKLISTFSDCLKLVPTLSDSKTSCRNASGLPKYCCTRCVLLKLRKCTIFFSNTDEMRTICFFHNI